MNSNQSIVQMFIKCKEGDQEKNLRLSEVAEAAVEFGPDLSSRMGDILLAYNKVDFTSIEKARRAYEKAFDKRFDSPFKDDAVRLFELVRNTLVHRSGIVDRQFILERSKLSPNEQDVIFALKVNDRLPMNGNQAARFFKLALDTGVKLIDTVHDILKLA